MKIEGSFVLQEPVNIVWEYLLNIDEISQCIPGIQMLETIDATNYHGTIQVKIGPIKMSFGGTVKLVEIEAPYRLVAAFEADDKRNTSKVKATFTSLLNSTSDGTEINYTMDVQIRGRLAQFGQAVVQSTVKTMAAAFSLCMQEKLGEGKSL